MAEENLLTRSKRGIAWDLSGWWAAFVSGIQFIFALWAFLAEQGGIPPNDKMHPDAWLPDFSVAGWIATGFASAFGVVLWKAAGIISKKNASLLAIRETGPKLVGFIDVVCGIAGYKGGRVLILLINVTNQGTPSLAHRWRVYIGRENELEREAKTIFIDREMVISFPDGQLRKIDGRESIVERVAHEPITVGGGKRGWLFATLDRPLSVGDRLTVRFRDVIDKESYAERLLDKGTSLPKTGKFPGVIFQRVKSANQSFDATALEDDF